MPRRFKLNYDKTNKYWFKYIKNNEKYEKKYFGHGPSKYADIKYYKAAVEKYDAWVREQEAPKTALQRAEDKQLRAQRKRNTKQRRTNVTLRRKNTIEGVFDRYMKYQLALSGAKTNERAQGSKTIVTAFNTFVKDFLRGGKTPDGLHDIKMLTDKKIKDYATYLRNRVHKGTYKASTARLYLGLMKKFCLWAYEQYFIDEIRGFQTIQIGGRTSREKPSIWTIDEIKLFWNAASEEVRTWILVAANTGFTNMDIGDIQIKHLELDTEGQVIRINKRRTKTGVEGTHLLFKETSRRLTEQLNKRLSQSSKPLPASAPLFITNRNEKICKTIVKFNNHQENKKNVTTRVISTHDKIGEQARRYLKPLRENGDVRAGLSMKHFRKTSATYIHEHMFKKGDPAALFVAQLFLCHSPKSIAEKNYIRTDKARLLDPCIRELEKFYEPVWLDDDADNV